MHKISSFNNDKFKTASKNANFPNKLNFMNNRPDNGPYPDKQLYKTHLKVVLMIM